MPFEYGRIWVSVASGVRISRLRSIHSDSPPTYQPPFQNQRPELAS